MIAIATLLVEGVSITIAHGLSVRPSTMGLSSIILGRPGAGPEVVLVSERSEVVAVVDEAAEFIGGVGALAVGVFWQVPAGRLGNLYREGDEGVGKLSGIDAAKAVTVGQ